jgi:hypothetical protein
VGETQRYFNAIANKRDSYQKDRKTFIHGNVSYVLFYIQSDSKHITKLCGDVKAGGAYSYRSHLTASICAVRPLPPGRFLVLISVRGWVHPRIILRLEWLGQLKNPVTGVLQKHPQIYKRILGPGISVAHIPFQMKYPKKILQHVVWPYGM